MKHIIKCALFLLLLGTLGTSFSSSLRGPWDPGFNKMTSQTKELAAIRKAEATISCPTAPDTPADLTSESVYSGTRGGKGDQRDEKKVEAYHRAVRPFTVTSQKIVSMADLYQRTREPRYAQCTAEWLESLASDSALNGKMTGFQSYFTQSWMLSAYSLAWLKVRNDPAITAAQKETVVKWLVDVAEKNKNYYDKNSGKTPISNMAYWGGVAILSAGIAGDRRDLYDWGVQKYRAGMDSVTKEGYLPGELKRGTRALGYHIFAAQALVTIAQLAEINGEDLYSYKDGAIKRLVKQIFLSVKDSSAISKVAGDTQVPVSRSAYFRWLIPSRNKFPDVDVDFLVKKYPRQSYPYLGGNPPLAMQ